MFGQVTLLFSHLPQEHYIRGPGIVVFAQALKIDYY